jgi:hypothetical protein
MAPGILAIGADSPHSLRCTLTPTRRPQAGCNSGSPGEVMASRCSLAVTWFRSLSVLAAARRLRRLAILCLRVRRRRISGRRLGADMCAPDCRLEFLWCVTSIAQRRVRRPAIHPMATAPSTPIPWAHGPKVDLISPCRALYDLESPASWRFAVCSTRTFVRQILPIQKA